MWNEVELAMKPPAAERFSQITRDTLIEAGIALKVGAAAASREIDRQVRTLRPQLQAVIREVERENADLPAVVRPYLGMESRLLAVIDDIIAGDMIRPMGRADR